MSRLTEEEMAKLPKWARSHLGTLYTQIADLKRDKKAWFDLDRRTQAQVVLPFFHDLGNLGTEGDQPLRDHQAVRFYLKERNDHGWAEYIDVRLDKDRERVHVHGGIGGIIIIEPQSGNTFNIGLRRF